MTATVGLGHVGSDVVLGQLVDARRRWDCAMQ
jgi:hypothetical protein